MRYLKIIKEQKHPFKFLIGKCLMLIGLCKLFSIKREHYTLKFYNSALSLALWVDPACRSSTENFYRDYLKVGDVVIDIGSNIGSTVLEASRCVGMTGKIYAFEPHPSTFRKLIGNLQGNRVTNVTPHNVALSDMNKRVVFSNLNTDDQNKLLDSGKGVLVRASTLDALRLPEKNIAVVKIDVEGCEKRVLEGMKNTLALAQCVYFESYEKHYKNFGYSFVDIYNLFQEYGYRVFKFLERKKLIELSSHYHSASCENLIAVRNIDEFLNKTFFEVEKNLMREAV